MTDIHKISFIKLIKEKAFFKYLLSRIISRFGDSIDTVAYGYMVFTMTGSAALLATIYAVNGIPSILFNAISGVVVNYWPKKLVVWIADLGRGLIVILTGILFINQRLEVWHLFVLTFLNSSFEAFRSTASTVLFTQIVNKDNYEHATSLNTSSSTLAELVGFGAVGILIGLIGIGGVIILDAITFFISAILIKGISVQEVICIDGKLSIKRYYTELKAGISFVTKNPLIRSFCFFAGSLNFFLVPFSALQTPYVSEVLEKGPYVLSIMGSGFMLAMILGSLSVPFIKKKISGHKMFVLSGVNIGLCYIFLALLKYINSSWILFLPLILICFIAGFSVPYLNVPIQVAIYKSVDKDYLPRVISLINMLSLIAAPFGGALAGALLGFFPITTLFYLFGFSILILFLMQSISKSLKDL